MLCGFVPAENQRITQLGCCQFYQVHELSVFTPSAQCMAVWHLSSVIFVTSQSPRLKQKWLVCRKRYPHNTHAASAFTSTESKQKEQQTHPMSLPDSSSSFRGKNMAYKAPQRQPIRIGKSTCVEPVAPSTDQ